MSTRVPRRASRSEVEPTSGLTDAFDLPSEHVDVWSERVDLVDPRPLIEVLDEAERDRAGRFRFELDRARFVARRAFLRRVLAGYLGLRAGDIHYRLTEHRRPELDPRCGVTFSTSHADGLAVVAVARRPRLGLDVERIRIVPNVAQLADGVLSAAERASVQPLEEPRRSEAFLRLWTRKEAYAKALGTGLSMSLDALDLGGPRPRMPGTADTFVFQALDVPSGFVGSIAASGSQLVVRRVDALALALAS